MLLRFFTALALAASLAGAAQAYAPHDREILSELPAHAPPGECYARVRAPSEPVAPPPVLMGAQWVLSPGPIGSPGPIWCLVPTGPAPVAMPAQTVERYGWIRVLCDADATPARIRGVQQKLSQRGYYRGEVSGRYDASTAAAVTQFQTQTHIGHGGYLSLQTLDALEQGAPPATYDGGYSYQQSGGYQQTGGYGYAVQAPPSPCLQTCAYAPPPPPPVYYMLAPQPPCCQAPVYQPPVYQPPCCQNPVVYAPPPCCAAAQPYGYQSYGYQGGYGQGYYAGSPTPAYAAAQASAYAGGGSARAAASAYSSTSAVQNGWLTWGGMTRY